MGLYDQSSATFYIDYDLSGGNADHQFNFGPDGNDWMPVAGDFNGNGSDGVALYNQEEAKLYIDNNLDGGHAENEIKFGPDGNDWIPVAGDFGGETDGIALYDQEGGKLYIDEDLDGGFAEQTVSFDPEDTSDLTPITGNWTGETPTTGEDYYLEVGQDDLTGTEYDDEFIANVSRTSWAIRPILWVPEICWMDKPE